MRLEPDFFLRTDVVEIARDLLGKVLITNFDGQRTAGIITETEAYRAPDDRASHAFGNRRTARTETMFQEGGHAYIYLCYGIHHLFNVVTAPENAAHAVLIRGIEPIEGQEFMLERRGKKRFSPDLTTGPGALSQALGLTKKWNGQNLNSPDSPIWLEHFPDKFLMPEIESGKRIGVDYAGECADWAWRFWIKNSRFAKQPRISQIGTKNF